MATNDPKKKDNKKKGDRHVSPKVVFHLPQSLLNEFEDWLNQQDPKPDKSAAMRSALKMFLKAKKSPGNN